jgi:hypothetical protein
MQSDAVVVDHPCRIDGTLQLSIALVEVEFELVRLHAKIIVHKNRVQPKMAQTITVALPDKHQEILEQYCAESGQSQTAVVKELILTLLKQRLKARKTE